MDDFTTDIHPILPDERQLPPSQSLNFGEAAIGGMIPTSVIVLLVAFIRILRVYQQRRNRPVEAQPCSRTSGNCVINSMKPFTTSLLKMKLEHPFTCLVSGPSGSGKSSLVKAIIAKQVIEPKPNKILWLYAEDQPLYKAMKDVEFVQGIPDDLEERFDPRQHNNLLILDDLMTKCHSDERSDTTIQCG